MEQTKMTELLNIFNYSVLEIEARIKEVELDESLTHIEKSNLKLHFMGELNGVLRLANYILDCDEYFEFLNSHFPCIK